MPDASWLDHYPFIAQLQQQPDDEVVYTALGDAIRSDTRPLREVQVMEQERPYIDEEV